MQGPDMASLLVGNLLNRPELCKAVEIEPIV